MLPEDELAQVHVQPGESRLVQEPSIVCTLLGSCVGITFWVRRMGIGALCHPMLPSAPARLAVQDAGAGHRRFVDFTIRELAGRFDALGATRAETVVKVFGGADVLDFDTSRARPTIGKLNRDAAMRILVAEGYRIAASSVGGRSGMQIRFNTNTGEVLLRRFGRAHKHPDPHRPRPSKANI